MFLLIILIIVIFIIAVAGGFLLFKKRRIIRLTKSLDMVLFLVKMPKYEKKEESGRVQDIKSIIGMMEQVYSNFLYLEKPKFIKKFLYGSPRVALEIASEVGGSDISFYVAVPTDLATSLEKYIQGVYPGAVLEKVPQDYTVFEPQGKTAASFLKLKKSVYFPINTYKNLESDPLASITNSLSKIYPEEGAAIQIILKPGRFDLKEK